MTTWSRNQRFKPEKEFPKATAHRELSLLMLGLLATLLILCIVPNSLCAASTMIRGGKGNEPIPDPGWPAGAEKIFNWQTRIAWWEDPPFGGGRWHSECKGDEDALSQVLRDFAKLESTQKQVIVKEGIGYSFWLDPNKQKRADRNTKIDWEFTIWEPDRWKFQRELPAAVSSITGKEDSPTATITVYSASIRWEEVEVPEGLSVIDNRLSAHGFEKSDGRVVEGQLLDEASKPIQGTLRIEHVQPREQGGYKYTLLDTIETTNQGRWVIKNFSDQWCRLIAEAPGYASRRVAYLRYDRQPGWESFTTMLAPNAAFHGRVTDLAGNPLDAAIRVTSITLDGERYDTDAVIKVEQGKFHIENLPSHSTVEIAAYLDGYASTRREISVPTEQECVIELAASGTIHVKVEFRTPRSGGFVVNVVPEGGDAVGRWGGSANIGEDGTFTFKNVPAGTYTLTGRPNPGSPKDTTESVTVTISGGDQHDVTLKAK